MRVKKARSSVSSAGYGHNFNAKEIMKLPALAFLSMLFYPSVVLFCDDCLVIIATVLTKACVFSISFNFLHIQYTVG